MSMGPLENTTTELLAGLHDRENRVAWEEFDRRYRPILIAFLRRMGLDEADSADVAQETLSCFIKDYRENKYDRSQGRLRTWLIGIARFRLADLRRADGRRREVRGESAMAALPAEPEAEAIWDAEQRRHIFDLAIRELRDSGRFVDRTIDAFERVVLRAEPVSEVAAELGMTAQEIYNAKNRVVERLREIMQRFENLLVA